MIILLKISGQCKCGFKRDIECDDSAAMQKLKDLPCHYCGGVLKYNTSEEFR